MSASPKHLLLADVLAKTAEYAENMPHKNYDDIYAHIHNLTVADINETYPDYPTEYPEDFRFGGDLLKKFANAYDPFHKPLTLVICIFGVMANALNVIVLTRKRMISPTNILLTGLSVNQLLLLLSYLSLLLYNYLLEKCLVPALLASYNWTVYKWVNVNINVAFHTTALAHTMCLTVFRFISIESPVFSRTKIRNSTARKCVLLLCLMVPTTCSPTFLTTYVHQFNETYCGLSSFYDLQYVQNQELFQVTLWLYGVVLKLLPSLSIAILSKYLIVSLKHINQKKQLLNCKESHERKTHRQRLTKMLVAVALLCISVELPHGIVNLLTGIFGRQFGREVYDNLGDVFEMLTLFYSSVNFVLYCLMSTQFQTTFKRFVIDPALGVCLNGYKWLPSKIKDKNNSRNAHRRMSNEIIHLTEVGRRLLLTDWSHETDV